MNSFYHAEEALGVPVSANGCSLSEHIQNLEERVSFELNLIDPLIKMGGLAEVDYLLLELAMYEELQMIKNQGRACNSSG